MHKTLSVLSLLGFIISSIKADEPYQPAMHQPSSDTPQIPFVPAAATYPNSDTLSLLNNPAYDPTYYANFVPQDTVQQFVRQYEGLLIPTQPIVAPTFISVLKSFVPKPKIVLAILAKIVALGASAVGIVFFGGAITSFICAFTPLCTLTFIGLPLSLLRKETKEMAQKIASEVTPERIKRASDLLQLAFDKYQQIQNE